MNGASDASPSSETEYIGRSGYFHEVRGFEEAVDILNDFRMHADMVGMFEGVGATAGPLWEIMSASLLSLNGEEHKRFRNVVAGRFTPRAVEGVRTTNRLAAHELIDTFAASGRCEFVQEFAAPYVPIGTCAHVGFDPEDVAACTRAIDLIAYATRDLGQRLAECSEGVATLVEYSRTALTERRAHPRDDVLTLVADAVEDGSLPEPVALAIIACLLSAGHEPTINQLGLMVSVLSDECELWEEVGTGRLEVGRVVEEVLRYRSTNQGVLRRVADSWQYRGVSFEENDQVLVALPAANHDPRRFPAPERMDPDANHGSHLAFGFGPHHCLGAALARVQLQEALRALTSRLTCPVVVSSSETEAGGLFGLADLTISFSERGI